MLFTKKFTDKVHKLSDSEKYVFYYIDNNINEAKNMSLTEMAEVNSVSTTTIIRMCKKLELSGFAELKYILKNLSTNNVEEDTSNIDTFKKDIHYILDNLNVEDIETLVSYMIKAKKVVIVSVGLTKTMGEYFSKLLMQSGKSTFYTYESHIIDLLPSMIDPEDLVIFISNSGATRTILDIGKKLNYGANKTAALVNSSDSPLSKVVDVSITGNSKKTIYNSYDITPRSSLMIIIDLVFSTYIKKISKA